MMPNSARDPSPVPLRLVKAPERDTLSPRERAVYLLSTPGFQPKMWDTLRSFTLYPLPFTLYP
jgi:hypothetical protein